MEGGRRFRRFGLHRGLALNYPLSVLPLHNVSRASAATRPRLSCTLSCWYCDLRIYAFTDPIFRIGRRYARYLRVWFSMGVGFGATLMIVLALLLLWELAGFLHLHKSNANLNKLVFGFSPTVYGLKISLADAGFIVLSTLISVCAHEIGHAIAAASEGVQVEHVAIFIAVLFPGALVAFNQDSLQALQRISALRIYCAGIWHNAVCCAISGLTLLLLPSILFPLYVHGQGLMVLEVPYSSPLHGYLSPGDMIVAVDDIPIRDKQDWVEAISLIDIDSNQESNHTQYVGKGSSKKGYCVPLGSLEERESIRHVDNVSTCLDDLTAFISTPCSDMDTTDYNDGSGSAEEHARCLDAKEVIKLRKCGDGWSHIVNGSSCLCLQDESCVTPIKKQGSMWVEVTCFSSYGSPACSRIEQTPLPTSQISKLTERNCSRSFVYVGDLFSLSNSVHFTSYRPRLWASSVGAYVPYVMEKILILTYHVSLTLALMNTLPVFFLDGESILEVNLSYCSWLSHRKSKDLLQLILAVGTLISVLSFVKMIAKGY
ncbi:membrane-bound transcription factor site-2 protease homolog isoform X2 [Punica granatum]|uniref:Endopeptidase S2P n=1 Tax=Punica granatum TaxID=22663 RepID=A0A6P8CLS2_PUNGR|nr:membrane-bound transcription factor site-2 protease homolog isoform X2 [Punica granatum]